MNGKMKLALVVGAGTIAAAGVLHSWGPLVDLAAKQALERRIIVNHNTEAPSVPKVFLIGSGGGS